MTTPIARSQDLRIYAEIALSVILPKVMLTAHEDAAGEVDYFVEGTSFWFCVGEHEGEGQILIYERDHDIDGEDVGPGFSTTSDSVDLVTTAWFPLDKPIDFAENLARLVAMQNITGQIEAMREAERDEE
jgi:hypothetical protein